MRPLILGVFAVGALAASVLAPLEAQDRFAETDKRVQAFLDRHRGTWRDLNVPESDGRVLYNLILKGRDIGAVELLVVRTGAAAES